MRGLTRDGDIMDVAFRKTRIGDLDEASSLLQILNGAGAGVAHRGLHAADKLMDYVLRRALIGHLPLAADRKSVASGKRVSVRVDLGGRRIIKKQNTKKQIK